MKVRKDESETRRQTRFPKGPERCETSKHAMAPASGLIAPIQSPQSDAVSLPYCVSRISICTMSSRAAIAPAVARIFDIDSDFLAIRCPQANPPSDPIFRPEYKCTPADQNKVLRCVTVSIINNQFLQNHSEPL